LQVSWPEIHEVSHFSERGHVDRRFLSETGRAATGREPKGDIMKNFLGTAVIVAGSLFAAAGTANASPAGETGKLSPLTQRAGTERVDFRPFRHCHGPRSALGSPLSWRVVLRRPRS
jgi:hypothetical protein